jgi:hypothetical protein
MVFDGFRVTGNLIAKVHLLDGSNPTGEWA